MIYNTFGAAYGTIRPDRRRLRTPADFPIPPRADGPARDNPGMDDTTMHATTTGTDDAQKPPALVERERIAKIRTRNFTWLAIGEFVVLAPLILMQNFTAVIAVCVVCAIATIVVAKYPKPNPQAEDTLGTQAEQPVRPDQRYGEAPSL